jgi:RNA polymerase sigma-70 factor (ECF subfamily)
MKDEEQLIAKARSGGADAFGRLYDEYAPRIYRFIFLKVSNKHDAEDLTHQVFMSAWESVRRYELKGFPFSSWLYRIASNAVIDFYRTAKNHQDIETIPEDMFAETPGLEQKLDRAQDLALTKTALAHLEPDQQTVLIMKFVDDLSNKEIAQALSKTEGSIRVIQHRALKQLKKHIDAVRPDRTTKEV